METLCKKAARWSYGGSMKRDERSSYLSSYPTLKKWINTCVCCSATGYNPEMPEVLTTKAAGEEIETLGAQNLRRLYPPLKVNAAGICENCERLLMKERR